MNKPSWEGAYTFMEGLAADGQMVKFTCRPEDKEKALEALKLFRDIRPPTTGRVQNVGHGGYGMYTRYDIVQHEYAGGHGGYVEALEIKDAPDDRCGSVVHHRYASTGSSFFEFEDLASAKAAFEKTWSGPKIHENLKACPGFKRYVFCGPRQPWFYAVGDQHITGDVVFPDCIMEDPVYRFGRKFVIRNQDDVTCVTECIGTYEERSPLDNRTMRRVVFFENGMIWREGEGRRQPEPLRGDQLWIHEAVRKFEEFLTGNIAQFAIEFMDGRKFIGSLSQGKCIQGTYWAKVELEDGEVMKGEFQYAGKDAKTCQTVEEYLRSKFVGAGKRKVAKILELKRRFRKHDWQGIFTPPED